jgi:hypothetical protein
MGHKLVGPNALVGAFGACDCASEWRHKNKYSITTPELHQDLRLARLRERHGLSGSRASLIASLAFDGDRR